MARGDQSNSGPRRCVKEGGHRCVHDGLSSVLRWVTQYQIQSNCIVYSNAKSDSDQTQGARRIRLPRPSCASTQSAGRSKPAKSGQILDAAHRLFRVRGHASTKDNAILPQSGNIVRRHSERFEKIRPELGSGPSAPFAARRETQGGHPGECRNHDFVPGRR